MSKPSYVPDGLDKLKDDLFGENYLFISNESKQWFAIEVLYAASHRLNSRAGIIFPNKILASFSLCYGLSDDKQRTLKEIAKRQKASISMVRDRRIRVLRLLRTKFIMAKLEKYVLKICDDYYERLDARIGRLGRAEYPYYSEVCDQERAAYELDLNIIKDNLFKRGLDFDIVREEKVTRLVLKSTFPPRFSEAPERYIL